MTNPVQAVFTTGLSNTACVTIYITNDEALEGDHDFTITITDAESTANITDPMSSIITIIDDECKFLIKELLVVQLFTSTIFCDFWDGREKRKIKYS